MLSYVRQHNLVRQTLKLVRLRFAVRIWALWVPIIARGTDFAPLLARAAPSYGVPYAGLSIDIIAKRVRRAIRRPWLMRNRRCLREGLLLNRFLVMAGYSPVLHFGVDRTSLGGRSVKAHCWVSVGERIFNPPDETMLEIHTHSSVAGQAEKANSAS
jgi:hypothetical protein